METGKIFLLTAFAFLILSVNISAGTGGNYLVMSGIQTNPDEIYSGNNFTLSFQIYNVWDHGAKDVYVQVQAAYPLTQLSPVKVEHVDSIAASHSFPSERIYFELHMDENAIAGTYPVTVMTTYRTRESVAGITGLTEKDVTYTESSLTYIVVRGKPKIAVSPSVKPEKVQPGSIASITLKVSNDGTDTAKDVRVDVEDTPTLKLLGTSRDIYVGNIEPKSSGTSIVQIEVDTATEAGIAELPVQLLYMDKNNNRYADSFKIPVIISVDDPIIDLSILNSQPSEIRPGDTSTIAFKVWNKGNGLAKNVRIQASDQYPFTVSWANRDLSLGDIQPNAFSTANIRVDVKENTTTIKWHLPIALSYDNVNGGKHFNSTENVEISLEETADFIVSEMMSDKQQVKPDAKWAPVSFQIKNIGTTAAKEIKVTLNTQYPITPTGKQQYLDELNPGNAVNVTFHVDVDSQAAPQSYPVDIYIDWKEGAIDKEYTATKSSSISVGAAESSTLLIIAGILITVVLIIVITRIRSSTAKKKKSSGD